MWNRETLSQIIFNFALKHVMMTVKENLDEMELNVTLHLLVYAEDVNKFGANIKGMKINTEDLLLDSREVHVEVSTSKTK
jgi:hypothetical protein